MIIIENINYDLVRLKVTAPISVGDFNSVAPQIDALIKEKSTIRLLVDGRSFKGWENTKAFKEHIGFVKNHHLKVKKIAIIARHWWQYCFVGIFRLFVHPKIRIFNANQFEDALRWVTEN